MEKQIFNERPETILDLGTGNSNVHLNITEVDIPEMGPEGLLINSIKYQADVIRIENPASRDRIISAIIKDRFTTDFREAALRKGIEDKNDSDYVLFNNYAESVKDMCTESGIY